MTEYTTLPNGWKVSTLNPSGISWFGNKIRVAAGATVHFDRNVSMASCMVRMEGNARIIVDEGATLTTSGSSTFPTIFFGCTDMWDAIEIGFNSGYNLNNTIIRNTNRVLTPLFGNKSSYIYQANNCRVQNCTFQDNTVGITLDFTGQGSSTSVNGTLFVPSVFSGNTFTTSNMPLGVVYCGLKIVFCALTVITGNTFEKVNTGFRIENSFVVVNSSNISNQNTGIIATKNSTLNVEKVTFDNVSKMVDANGSRYVGVKSCILTHGTGAGVTTTGNGLNKPDVLIYNNDMTFQAVPTYAINVERSPTTDLTTTKNQVDHNMVHVAGSAADLTTMRSIANQCPLQGGMAVTEIPVFLPIEEALVYTRDDYWANCVDSVQNRQDSQVIVPPANNILTVFPNPVNQQLSLFLAQADEAAWAITDLTGRIWQQGQLPAEQNSVTLTTQNLPVGLYLCTVHTRSGLLLTAKINIQH